MHTAFLTHILLSKLVTVWYHPSCWVSIVCCPPVQNVQGQSTVTQYTFFTIDCVHWPMNFVMLTSFCSAKLNHHHLPGPVGWIHHHLVWYLKLCWFCLRLLLTQLNILFYTSVCSCIYQVTCSCTMYTAAAVPWTGLSCTCPSLCLSVCVRMCVQKQFGKWNFCLFLCPELYTICSSCNNNRWNKVLNVKTL
jgi:hypothetical protein